MKKLFSAVLLISLCTSTAVAHERERIKVEVTETPTVADHVQSSALHLGTTVKHRLTVRAIVNTEHVLLECENDKCESLAPGEYFGTFHGSTVRMEYTTPLDHRQKHDEYRLLGSW